MLCGHLVTASATTLETPALDRWTVFTFVDKDAASQTFSSIPTSLPSDTGGSVAATPVMAEKINSGYRINFEKIAGSKREKAVALAFTHIWLNSETTLTFGTSADWWMAWSIDGKPVYSTLAEGNGTGEYSVGDHAFSVKLSPGNHMLTCKVLSGSGGWQLVVGFDTIDKTKAGVPAKIGTDYFTQVDWKLLNPQTASLSSDGDGLSIKIAPGVSQPITIYPGTPLIMPASAKRLSLLADPAVMGWGAPWRPAAPPVRVQLRDARGDIYNYILSQGSYTNLGWGKIATEELALPPSYSLLGKKKPKSPFTLLSLEITPGWRGLQNVHLQGMAADEEARPVTDRPWQIVLLADPDDQVSGCELRSVDIGYSNYDWHGSPAIDRDALVDAPGAYCVGVRVRGALHGPIVSEFRKNIVVGADLQPQRQILPLSIPRPGSYFVEARIWNQDGSLRDVKHFFVIAPHASSSQPVDQNGGGFISLRSDSPEGVFAPGQVPSFKIEVKIGAISGEKRLHITLTDYGFHPLNQQDISLPSSGQATWTGAIQLPASATGACRATVELLADGKTIDRDCIMLGRQILQAASPDKIPTPPHADFSRFRGVTSSSFLVSEVSPPGLEILDRIDRGMDQAIRIGNSVVEIQIPWKDLEPLPGLYQFGFLDKIMAKAQAKGIKVVFIPWVLSGQLPNWILPHVACYENGLSSLIEGSQYFSSPSDPVIQKAIHGLWQAIASRYAAHPALAGYLIVGPSCDLGYWTNGMTHDTDFSVSSLPAFRDYIRTELGYSLPDAAKRYGQMLASWDDLLPPQMNWDTEYDFRPLWIDWRRYEQSELYGWMETIYQAIRQYDPSHAVYQYQTVSWGSEETYYPLFKKYQIGATTGGNVDFAFMSLYHLWGFPSRGGEAIQDVQKWDEYQSLLNMLAYGADGAYYEVQWHNAFPEQWDIDPNGAKNLADWSSSPGGGGWIKRAHDLNFAPEFAKLSGILKEMKDVQPLPAEAGSLYSWTNNLYKARWLNPYSFTGTAERTWTRIEHRMPIWVSDRTPLDLYRHQKLLLADSDIQAMTQSTAENLRAYVDSGGCLVTFATTGMYTVETGQPDFGFLSGFGFKNVRPLKDKEGASVAVATGILAGQTLVFNSLYSASLPSGAETIAALPDGTPCAVRLRTHTGELILFLGDLDWNRSSKVLGALCTYKEIPTWCDANDSRLVVSSLRSGNARYTMVHYVIDNYGQPILNFVGKNPISAKIKIFGLTQPRYDVRELYDNRELGVFSKEQLEQGVGMEILSGELKIIKCTPAGQVSAREQ